MNLTVHIDRNILLKLFAMLLFLYLGLKASINLMNIATDDSDRDGFHRSGFTVQTDYKSGLQYLVTQQGGVTPRLDVDGHQIRVRGDQ